MKGMWLVCTNVRQNKDAHSSRMYTGRALTDGGCLPPGGGGVCLQGGSASRGVSVSGGGSALGKADPPIVDRMTDACENITFPHTTYAVGKHPTHIFEL